VFHEVLKMILACPPSSVSDVSPEVSPLDLVQVERAISEYRSGRAVLIQDGQDFTLAMGVENLDQANAAMFMSLASGPARLVLPAARLRRLGLLNRQVAGSVALPVLDCKRVEMLALKVGGHLDAPAHPVEVVDDAAFELARLSLVSPAVILAPAQTDDAIICVSAEALRQYRASSARLLTIISRAPVPLEDAPVTEFVVFRGGEGMRDQVAIRIGHPDLKKPVPVRMHSACLTGDLFGSLKCDCGDQLRGTVKWMAENGGGILLYLDQEGRGNGLANKIRAYQLQSQGWDTYDADEELGFGLDQRRFDFAGEMLKQLGVKCVSLFTNNPQKIAALKEAGIKVMSEQRVMGRQTDENISYLASKRDRAGHSINLEQMIVRAPVQD
jgi:GTP cyclohydrolase II